MEFEEHILPKEEKLPTLLPVKVKGKWVYKANDIDDGKSDSEKEETKNKVQSNKETSEKPNIVLMVQIADSIMSKPQENYKLLHTLREYCQHPDLSLKEQQLGILTLCRIYMDILPDYKMREYKESDLNASFKKDVKSLRNYEFGILTQYQLYLQNLHTIIDKGYQTNTNHKATLCYASVKSLQQLMFSKPNFNFRKNIIQVLCTKANSGSFNLSDSEHLCTETLIELIKRDRLGLISLEITQYIVQVINKRKFNLHENVLMVLSHLNLSERIIDAKLGKRKDTDMMSKKQKKRYKKQKELDKEMREAESSYNTEEQVQFQRQTLEALYQIVFKILKKADGDCRLIYPAILLIGKFGHLITIDVVPGVFKMLRVIALNNNYDMPSRIACGYAAKMLLFRGSDELSLDLNSFFIAYYRLLDELTTTNLELLEMYLNTLSDLLWRTRVTTSPERVAAFIKKLSIYCISCSKEQIVLSILFLIRLFMTSYSKCMQMVEIDEEKVFCGLYNGSSDEPDASCALSASLWEISSIGMSHYSTAVREAALLLLLDLKDMSTQDVIVNKPDPKHLNGFFKSSEFPFQ